MGPVDLQASPGLAVPSSGRRRAVYGARWRYPCPSLHQRRRTFSKCRSGWKGALFFGTRSLRAFLLQFCQISFVIHFLDNFSHKYFLPLLLFCTLQIKVWRMSTGKRNKLFDAAHQSPVTSLAFSNDNGQLLTARYSNC